MESRNGATMNRSTENFGNKRLNLRWTPTGFQPIDPDDVMLWSFIYMYSSPNTLTSLFHIWQFILLRTPQQLGRPIDIGVRLWDRNMLEYPVHVISSAVTSQRHVTRNPACNTQMPLPFRTL